MVTEMEHLHSNQIGRPRGSAYASRLRSIRTCREVRCRSAGFRSSAESGRRRHRAFRAQPACLAGRSGQTGPRADQFVGPSVYAKDNGLAAYPDVIRVWVSHWWRNFNSACNCICGLRQE